MATKKTRTVPYTAGQKVESIRNQWHRPGMPEQWDAAEVFEVEEGNGFWYVSIRFESDGYQRRELVGPRGGNRKLRKTA